MYGGDFIRDPEQRVPREEEEEGEGVPEEAVDLEREEGEGEEETMGGAEEEEMIGWDGPDDPDNPQNWSVKYKWFLTMICVLMTVNVYVPPSSFLLFDHDF